MSIGFWYDRAELVANAQTQALMKMVADMRGREEGLQTEINMLQPELGTAQGARYSWKRKTSG